MTNQTEYEKGYAAGVKDEKTKSILICEAWHSQNYIQGRYGNYGDYDLKVILKTATLIQEDIAAT